ELFSVTTSTFGPAYRVGTIDGTSVCAICDVGAFNKTLLEAAFEKSRGISEELRIAGGYFLPWTEEDQAVSKDLNSAHAINFARYAASDYARRETSNIERFTERTASRLLVRLRELRLFDQGIVDHDRLVAAGVKSAGLENSTGLCYSALQRYADALKCYE